MKYLSIEFEWYSKAHKGRVNTSKVTIAAKDLAEAFRLAHDEGQHRFPRYVWQLVNVEEIESEAQSA